MEGGSSLDDALDIRAVEEFAALVGHELRTPLAVIESGVRVVQADADRLTEEQRGALASVARNVRLALFLLDRLATARAVEADDLLLRREEVDLVGLARTVVEDLREVILAPRPCEVSAPTERIVVEVDPERLGQVLFNLLSNAARHSPPTMPVHVEFELDDDEVRVVVRDHGHGVAPEDVERVFERFVRLDAEDQGAGLGLYVSRGIARAHGGDLIAQPVDGDVEGGRFVLSLPR